MIKPGLILAGGLLLFGLVITPGRLLAQAGGITGAPMGGAAALTGTPPAVAPRTGGTGSTPAGGGGTPATTITKTGFIGKLGATVGCTTDPSTDLGALITFLICTLSRYATAIAVLIIMAAGLLYITSGANPAAAGTAKAMIVTTLTGIVAMYSISLVLSILINTGVVKKAAGPTTPIPPPVVTTHP